jgi:hypothetical protein
VYFISVPRVVALTKLDFFAGRKLRTQKKSKSKRVSANQSTARGRKVGVCLVRSGELPPSTGCQNSGGKTRCRHRGRSVNWISPHDSLTGAPSLWQN